MITMQDILAHPALTSTAPQNGAEAGKLRIVCLAPGLVGVALESLGFANQRLAEQQADYRLQVGQLCGVGNIREGRVARGCR
jgi:hypothetical protein